MNPYIRRTVSQEKAAPAFFVIASGLISVFLFFVMSFNGLVLSGILAAAVAIVLDKILPFDFYNSRKIIRKFSLVQLVIFFVIYVTFTFILIPKIVETSSMRPILEPPKVVLISGSKSAIGATEYSIGDIVSFNTKDYQKKSEMINMTKRIVGVEGDIVSYRSKILSINGKTTKIKNSNLKSKYEYLDESSGKSNLLTISLEKIGQKTVSVLNDSKYPDYILSKVIVENFGNGNCEFFSDGFECSVPKNKFFVMGDNRDRSFDSRYFGFIQKDQIVGKVLNAD